MASAEADDGLFVPRAKTDTTSSSSSPELITPPANQRIDGIDRDAITIRVKPQQDATIWVLSKKSIRGACMADSPLIAAVNAHKNPNTTLLWGNVADNVFDLFADYLKVWSAARPSKPNVAHRASLLEWFRLWIMGFEIKAPGLQSFALLQSHKIVIARIQQNPDAHFKLEVGFLWKHRPSGCPLRTYILDVYRTACLCTLEKMADFEEDDYSDFRNEIIQNLQDRPKGLGGKDGLRTLNLKEYKE